MGGGFFRACEYFYVKKVFLNIEILPSPPLLTVEWHVILLQTVINNNDDDPYDDVDYQNDDHDGDDDHDGNDVHDDPTKKNKNNNNSNDNDDDDDDNDDDSDDDDDDDDEHIVKDVFIYRCPYKQSNCLHLV